MKKENQTSKLSEAKTAILNTTSDIKDVEKRLGDLGFTREPSVSEWNQLNHNIISDKAPKAGRPKKDNDEMNEDDKGVCDRIAFIISQSGDTQAQAASKMNTKQTAISRIINHKNAPSLTMLKRFLSAYNANPMFILFDERSSGYYLNQTVSEVNSFDAMEFQVLTERLKKDFESMLALSMKLK